MDTVIEKKEKRYQYLHHLYEISKGDEKKIYSSEDLGQALGLSIDETDLVVQYLVGEYLIKKITVGIVSIAHRGVMQIENALSKPDQPTDYFPPVNIINIHQMTNSQIQQGTNFSDQIISIKSVDLQNLKEATKFGGHN